MTHVALIRVSWPAPWLNPNARVHWRRIRGPKGAGTLHKEEAFFAAKAQSIHLVPKTFPHVSFTFCPPDRRRRDEDNLIASLKWACDGIRDAWGVDDSKWRRTYEWAAPVKGGCVLIECRDSGVTMVEHRGVIR